MMATELIPGVHWVGAIDWNLRDHHGYTLPGTTYNAYLVQGEKTALIDGAYAGFLSYLRGLRPGRLTAKKIGCAFGSHGGMGGAVARANEALQAAGIEVIEGGLQVNYRPDGDELARAYELGRKVAREIRSR